MADPNSGDPINLGNGSITADQRSIIDQGFLELVRLGVLPATDPIVRASLTIVDQVIKRTTPSGPGFYRYGTSAPGPEDGYGDCYEPDPTNCHPTGHRGRRRTPAPATCGQSWMASAASTPSRAATGPRRRPSCKPCSGRPPARASSPGRSGRTRPSHHRRSGQTRRQRRSASPPAGRQARRPLTWAQAQSRPAGIFPECRAQPRNARDRYRSLRQPRHARQTPADGHLAGERLPVGSAADRTVVPGSETL
jgi:glucoamylase